MEVNQTILIVDDRPQNLHALEIVLAETGAQLVRATRGEEALAATLERDFALAILDVQMPSMDGYELAELLRGDAKTRNLPIIFLSAIAQEQEQIFKGYELQIDFSCTDQDGVAGWEIAQVRFEKRSRRPKSGQRPRRRPRLDVTVGWASLVGRLTGQHGNATATSEPADPPPAESAAEQHAPTPGFLQVRTF